VRLDAEVIDALLARYSDDEDAMDMIVDALEAFEEYHRAIYALELTRRMWSAKAIDAERYRAETAARDRTRTLGHNAVLVRMNGLNRLAEEAGLSPVYDGVVSKERPYRRQAADAVLAFVEDVIRGRA